MNATELKTKSKSELNDLLITLLQEQFQLRMKKAAEDTAKPHLLKNVRKNIARVKTILNQQNVGEKQ